jgi:hypothetical protein
MHVTDAGRVETRSTPPTARNPSDTAEMNLPQTTENEEKTHLKKPGGMLKPANSSKTSLLNNF